MLKQAVCAGLEVAINKAIALDEQSKIKLENFEGNSCEISLIELDFPLLFRFCDARILVSSPQYDSSFEKVTLTNQECKITLSVFAIAELSDMSNITRLIREGKLDFEGNLNIAQQVSGFVKDLNIDIEDYLSRYIGDAGAYTTVRQVKKAHLFLLEQGALAVNTLCDAMLDEKPVAVRQIMVENFNEEVGLLRLASDRLEGKLARLEARIDRPIQKDRHEN